MLRRRGRRAGAIACLAAMALAVATSDAAAPASGAEPGPIDGPAVASAVATRLRADTSGDLVSVYETSNLSSTTHQAVAAAAASVGASVTLATGFSTGMVGVRRGGTYVQQASAPVGVWQFPMGITVMPLEAMGPIMGDRVASTVASGAVVMGQTTADLRGARAGDVADLVAADGSIVSFTIGAIAPDPEVGGTEIVMSPEQAARLGQVPPSRVIVYGSFDRTAIDLALAANGLHDAELHAGRRIRIRRSWSAPDPDGTMGLARTKSLLGEFDYTVSGSGVVSVDADWRAARIVRVDFEHIGIRAHCNTAVVADLQAALTEVAQAGLAWAIDLANTNSYGGCYYPRFNRVTGNLGFLSRHSWGQPIDMNTVTNAQGTVPRMDCRVVRIFRKHGFAWGGNFLSSDGMHFEWVGEPRHELQYPSRYCPNLPGGAVQSFGEQLSSAGTGRGGGADGATARDTFFVEDGWDPAHG